MNWLPTHGHIQGFSLQDNCLCIAGRKLTDIVDEATSTPLYIYDGDLITQRIGELRAAFPEEVKFHYAIKANPMPAVVRHIAGQVDGLDVASGGELDIALTTGVSRSDISFAGPGKTDWELRAAIEARVVLNIESPNELTRVHRIAAELGKQARVAVRVNPDFELKSSGMKMSGGPKAFGIDAEMIAEVLAQQFTDRMIFEGFHIFTGSQNLSASAICEAQSKSLNLAVTLAQETGLAPRFINIGGGFGIPYFANDEPLSLTPIADNLIHEFSTVRALYPDAEIVIELGRYIVGEAGIYVAEVIDRKISRSEIFLVTNGGMNHHLAASGNFGQIIRKNYPMVIGNNVVSDDRVNANIVGPLCTPLDVLGSKISVPAETREGDLVVLFQSGAYGRTASPVNFLGQPDVKEILLKPRTPIRDDHSTEQEP